MLRSCRRLLSANSSGIHVIKSQDQFEALKLTSRVLVGYFNAHFSTPGKLQYSKFEDMAKASASSNATFFVCDVDDAPKVAYDCEVTDVPSVTVLPLGMKADGSSFDKSEMVTVNAGEDLDYDNIVSNGKAAWDTMAEDLNAADPSESKRKPWRFDPATGTTLPPIY